MVNILNDEKDILLDHEYDGIHELDNYLPSWWKMLFFITIVFSVVYFVGYEVLGIFDQPQQEYEKELALYPDDYDEEEESEIDENDIAKFLAAKQNKKSDKKEVIVAFTDVKNLAKGKRIFRNNCVICHGKNAEGMLGQGPNLTDNFWVHGEGKIEDIINTVKIGVIEKGMQPWAAALGNTKILQVVSYIMSLNGSNPPNAKAPEGKEY
ncbi:cbb3-type cytochrome c oxidase N-terminal domain-containing protein [Candidatus Uabimicrobium sp. HlEnr_7]|uniref:cbb3-type cytochrome c oxidase N-terminal domain-containing protein n=1 Tax=Candidatus Uabimicrobium helgolandensis TaxID=3095367 RepID=UPI003558E44B